MLWAYFNYPNSKIRIHGQKDCSEIGKMRKAGQRSVEVDDTSISSELRKFSTKTYRFAADPTSNDLWLQVNFGDSDFEEAVVAYIQRLVAADYSPFRVRIDRHC
jgi:hypothetical protein